ncbi:uncharacterized protein N7483_000952 [Penicillium malachiteum]|uniref:uncharacterized protein n=1 Tax=Penicillium malachiteum TaxID=1324776 RepID=UPI0025491B90|nr:uncharacterized protein N7483_000952 [Penicillium malachiteum]KAJ5735827.1 hypothetical protein N7483_000952 [Penicillium malachiteum]
MPVDLDSSVNLDPNKDGVYWGHGPILHGVRARVGRHPYLLEFGALITHPEQYGWVPADKKDKKTITFKEKVKHFLAKHFLAKHKE